MRRCKRGRRSLPSQHKSNGRFFKLFLNILLGQGGNKHKYTVYILLVTNLRNYFIEVTIFLTANLKTE